MNRYFIFYPIPRDPSCLATGEANSQIAQNQFNGFLVTLFISIYLVITEPYTLTLMTTPVMAESDYALDLDTWGEECASRVRRSVR